MEKAFLVTLYLYLLSLLTKVMYLCWIKVYISYKLMIDRLRIRETAETEWGTASRYYTISHTGSCKSDQSLHECGKHSAAEEENMAGAGGAQCLFILPIRRMVYMCALRVSHQMVSTSTLPGPSGEQTSWQAETVVQFGDIEDELWVITCTLNEHLESVDNIYKKKSSLYLIFTLGNYILKCFLIWITDRVWIFLFLLSAVHKKNV